MEKRIAYCPRVIIPKLMNGAIKEKRHVHIKKRYYVRYASNKGAVLSECILIVKHCKQYAFSNEYVLKQIPMKQIMLTKEADLSQI